MSLAWGAARPVVVATVSECVVTFSEWLPAGPATVVEVRGCGSGGGGRGGVEEEMGESGFFLLSCKSDREEHAGAWSNRARA